MVRPHNFRVNPETENDNSFQIKGIKNQILSKDAYIEVTNVVEALKEKGVKVNLFEDTDNKTPDSVFPNNWFSTHAGGHICIYPIKAENRRHERRPDILEFIKHKYRVQDIIDYSGLEFDGLYLEGTGAMVLDHLERVAYAIRSDRTNPIVLERFCTQFNFEPMVFDAQDHHRKSIYHTNVLMCIATEFALISLDMIIDSNRSKEICNRLSSPGREIINLTKHQIASFAGNAIELQGSNHRILAISSTAYKALTQKQIKAIESYVEILPMTVDTIEMAGGSIRCMIAGNHLIER